MEIDMKSLWGRWFLWSFWDDSTRWQYKYGQEKTNLCHFMRVCLIWGPIKIAFPVFVTSVFMYFLFAGGFIQGLKIISFILAVLAMFGLGIVVIWGVHALFTRTLTDSVIARYIVAKKNKYCPIVTLTK